MEQIRERFASYCEAVGDGLLEREEAVRITVLAAIAGHNTFLLGEPGIGKSLLCRKLQHIFALDAGQKPHYFEYLMHQFSEPDQLFGPLDLKELKEGEYSVKNEGYLPKAHIAFLDEIWKANPAIQNTLLTILNEKKFHNGNTVENVPLLFFICASNELPAKSEESLQALWDRISVRLELPRLKDSENFVKLLNAAPAKPECEVAQPLRINGQNNELAQWRAQIAALPLGKTATAAMCHIKQKLRDYNEGNEEPIFVSDRRYQQIAFLVRAAAFCNGHSEPDIIDASVMLHCMWQKGEERKTLEGFWHEICTAHAIAAELDSDAIQAQLERYRNAVKKHYAKEQRRSQKADRDGYIKLEQPLRKVLDPQYVAVHKDSWAELQQHPSRFANNWWQPRFKLSSGGDWCDSDTMCQIDPSRTNAWQTHITRTYNNNWTGPMVLKNQTTKSAGFDNQKFIETNQNGVTMAIMQNRKTLAALETEYQKLETLLAAGMVQVKTERGEKAGVYQANFFCRAEDLRLLTEPAAKVMETLENLRLEAQGIRAEYQSALQDTKRALKAIQSELREWGG